MNSAATVMTELSLVRVQNTSAPGVGRHRLSRKQDANAKARANGRKDMNKLESQLSRAQVCLSAYALEKS